MSAARGRPHRLTRARAAASAIFAANGLAFAIWAASLPAIAARLRLSDRALAAGVFAASAGAIAAMPLVARIANRRGPRGPMLAGGALAPLLVPLAVGAPGFWALLALAAAFGVGIGTMEVAMNAYAVRVERAARRPWMSAFHGWWSLGALSGSLALTALTAHRVPHASAAAAALALAAALAGALRAPAVPERGRAVAAGGGPSPAILALAAMAVLGLLVEGALADWSAVFFRAVLHVPLAVAPLGYAVFAGAMLAGRFGGDAVVRRAGRRRTLAASAVLAGVALGTALAVPSVAVATVCFALAGLGCANLAPAVFGAAGRAGGANGLATVSAVGYAAFLVGPAAIGTIADAAGLRAGLTVAVACAFGVAAIAASPRLRAPLAS